MRSCRFISSRPISLPATASCCRMARPPRRSSPRPPSPALLRPFPTRIFTSPMARSPPTRRSRSRLQKGARRLIILPTGYACATNAPPVGAVANVLHALTLLIARQLVSELEDLDPDIEYFVVPPLCPLVGSPYDFSRTADHIDRADREHRRLARAKWPGERAYSGRDAAARATEPRLAASRSVCNVTLHVRNR